jgi:hypothetical protein
MVPKLSHSTEVDYREFINLIRSSHFNKPMQHNSFETLESYISSINHHLILGVFRDKSNPYYSQYLDCADDLSSLNFALSFTRSIVENKHFHHMDEIRKLYE